MSEVIASIELIFHVLLAVTGVFIVIIILKVYNLYQIMKINRSVMTPMLFAGVFAALSGISALIEANVGEVGHVAHELAMFLTVVFFAYGIYSYQQMLDRTTKLR
jgi:hypothetical protein